MPRYLKLGKYMLNDRLHLMNILIILIYFNFITLHSFFIAHTKHDLKFFLSLLIEA